MSPQSALQRPAQLRLIAFFKRMWRRHEAIRKWNENGTKMEKEVVERQFQQSVVLPIIVCLSKSCFGGLEYSEFLVFFSCGDSVTLRWRSVLGEGMRSLLQGLRAIAAMLDRAATEGCEA
jgi:hypothetical protein